MLPPRATHSHTRPCVLLPPPPPPSRPHLQVPQLDHPQGSEELGAPGPAGRLPRARRAGIGGEGAAGSPRAGGVGRTRRAPTEAATGGECRLALAPCIWSGPMPCRQQARVPGRTCRPLQHPPQPKPAPLTPLPCMPGPNCCLPLPKDCSEAHQTPSSPPPLPPPKKSRPPRLLQVSGRDQAPAQRALRGAHLGEGDGAPGVPG